MVDRPSDPDWLNSNDLVETEHLFCDPQLSMSMSRECQIATLCAQYAIDYIFFIYTALPLQRVSEIH